MNKFYTYEEWLIQAEITDEERYKPCENCNGEGEHTCDCGHTHDCGECNGKGRFDVTEDVYERLCKEQEKKLEEWNSIFI